MAVGAFADLIARHRQHGGLDERLAVAREVPALRHELEATLVRGVDHAAGDQRRGDELDGMTTDETRHGRRVHITPHGGKQW